MREMIRLFVNGANVEVPDGVTVAAALLASRSDHTFRTTQRRAEPRGMFCGMGLCFDCLVTVDGRPEIRACMTTAAAGMRIETR